MPVRRRVERVPRGEERARLLRLPQPEDEVREADERRSGEPDRLRQRVVGAMSERVAVEDEQRSHVTRLRHSRSRHSRSIACIQPVGQRLRRPFRRPGCTVRDPQPGEPREPVGALDRRRDDRHAGVERDPRGAGARPRLDRLFRPFLRRVPSGNIATACPSRASATAVVDRLLVVLARVARGTRRPRRGSASGNQYSSDFAMKRRKRCGQSGRPSGHGSKFERGSRRARSRRRAARSPAVRRKPVETVENGQLKACRSRCRRALGRGGTGESIRQVLR